MALNGRLPGSDLAYITGTTRRILRDLVPQTDALRSAFLAHFGKSLVITDAYRTLQEQVDLKKQKGPFAATPGYSNHGWGRAIDFGSMVNVEGSPEYAWMKANAPKFGWSHPRWAEDHNPANGQQEPWHWEAAEAPVPASNYVHIAGAVPDAPHLDPIPDIEPVLPKEDEMWVLRNTADGKIWYVSTRAYVPAYDTAEVSAVLTMLKLPPVGGETPVDGFTFVRICQAIDRLRAAS